MDYSKSLLVILLITALLLISDVVSDLHGGTSYQHVIFEILAFIGAISGAALVAKSTFQNLHSHLSTLEKNLNQLSKDQQIWKKKAQSLLSGLGEVIDQQFEDWHFSAAEKEVALFVLKGLTHKEIANVRGTAEKTVRHQAATAYAKAGLEGKAQLAAFFLEDLMLPKVPSSDHPL